MTRWEGILPRVNDLLDGRLSAAEEQEVRRLLQEDAECARRFEQLRALVSGLKRLRAERAPAGFSGRVLEALAAEPASPGLERARPAGRTPRLHLLVRYGSLAASLAAVLVIGFLILRGGSRESTLSNRAEQEVARGDAPRPAAAPAAPSEKGDKWKDEEGKEDAGLLGRLGANRKDGDVPPPAAEEAKAKLEAIEEAEEPAADAEDLLAEKVSRVSRDEDEFQGLVSELAAGVRRLREAAPNQDENKRERPLERAAGAGAAGAESKALAAADELAGEQAAATVLLALGRVTAAAALDRDMLMAEAERALQAGDPLAGVPAEVAEPARRLEERFGGRVRIVAADRAGMLRLLENAAAAGCRIEDLAPNTAEPAVALAVDRASLEPGDFFRVRAAAPGPLGPTTPGAGGAPATGPATGAAAPEGAAAKKGKERGGPAAAPAEEPRYILILVLEE